MLRRRSVLVKAIPEVWQDLAASRRQQHQRGAGAAGHSPLRNAATGCANIA